MPNIHIKLSKLYCEQIDVFVDIDHRTSGWISSTNTADVKLSHIQLHIDSIRYVICIKCTTTLYMNLLFLSKKKKYNKIYHVVCLLQKKMCMK